jgi:hypothetical protein
MKAMFARRETAIRALCAALFGSLALLALANPTIAEQRNAGVETVRSSDPVIVANDILNRWEPIAIAALAHSPVWREMFATQLTAMEVAVLRSIDAVKADRTDAKTSYARFAQAVRAAEAESFRLARSSKGRMKLDSTTTDQVFVPIVPCRIVDTRNAGGPIAAGSTRNFFFYATNAADDWSTQGGVAGPTGTTCPGTILPNGGVYAPSAAVVTITVVSPSAAGNWVVWGGEDPIPTASALNWTGPGQILANTTVIPEGGRVGTGSGGPIFDFAVRYNGPTGSAQFVADVVGYLVKNQATALDCYESPVQSIDATGSTGITQVFSDGCSPGWTQTAGNCDGDAFSLDVVIDAVGAPYPSANWLCRFFHRDNGAAHIHASSVCCRVPGR